jgi:hypothetical protein
MGMLPEFSAAGCCLRQAPYSGTAPIHGPYPSQNDWPRINTQSHMGPEEEITCHVPN